MGGCSFRPMEPQSGVQNLLGPSSTWGSIDEILQLPPEAVTDDQSWLSAILMWVFFPLNLFQALLGGACQCIFRWFSYTAMQSQLNGKPFCEWYVWWRFVLTTLFALIFNGRSRLKLFLWEREAWGNGDHFFHGEGIWLCPHAAVDAVMTSNQPRVPSFACITACIPDLFPKGLVLFLPNLGPESEWGKIRASLHSLFLDQSGPYWKERIGSMPSRLAVDWPNPKLSDLNDVSFLNRVVVKCIWYMMLGNWVADGEAETLSGWREMAGIFVLPRLVQRMAFNAGINKVKRLRKDTVGLVERYGLQEIFHKFNQELPEKFRRKTVVQLCDELMYAVGFAGIGGTCACVENVTAFLQVKLPKENKADHVDFSRYSTPQAMAAAYKADPVSYIKEVCRLAPPVTSCTAPLPGDATVNLGGILVDFPKGTLRQLTLSIANRDSAVFRDPTAFDPRRPELNRALTWNGAYGMTNEETNYPRICPGRHLSLQVAQIILNRATSTL